MLSHSLVEMRHCCMQLNPPLKKVEPNTKGKALKRSKSQIQIKTPHLMQVGHNR
jgi:hypothetical protein